MELDLNDMEKRVEKAFRILFLVKFYCQAKAEHEFIDGILLTLTLAYNEVGDVYDKLLCYNNGWSVD